jgi:hypothetical protein
MSFPKRTAELKPFSDLLESGEVIAEDRIAVAEGLGVLLIPPQTSEPGLPTSINWVR